MPGDRHEPAHALGDLVDAGAAFIGPVLSKAGNAAVDDARVDLFHRLVIDAEPVLYGRFEILDDDVGLFRHLHEELMAFLALQIDRDRALGAVEHGEIKAIGLRNIAELAARDVAGARPFDLDHIGTHESEKLGAGRTGLHVREIEDAHAVERHAGLSPGLR